MLLANADDDEVGGLVRELHANTLQQYLDGIIGNRAAAALFMATILGFSVAEKSLHLSGISAPSSEAYEAQLRHLLNNALAYSGA
jgi:hypothetical protein